MTLPARHAGVAILGSSGAPALTARSLLAVFLRLLQQKLQAVLRHALTGPSPFLLGHVRRRFPVLHALLEVICAALRQILRCSSTGNLRRIPGRSASGCRISGRTAGQRQHHRACKQEETHWLGTCLGPRSVRQAQQQKGGYQSTQLPRFVTHNAHWQQPAVRSAAPWHRIVPSASCRLPRRQREPARWADRRLRTIRRPGTVWNLWRAGASAPYNSRPAGSRLSHLEGANDHI